jgi:hypothetical protein
MEDSPCIDKGDPASAYADEPPNNGGRINLGADGNTREASRKPLGISFNNSGTTSGATGGSINITIEDIFDDDGPLPYNADTTTPIGYYTNRDRVTVYFTVNTTGVTAISAWIQGVHVQGYASVNGQADVYPQAEGPNGTVRIWVEANTGDTAWAEFELVKDTYAPCVVLSNPPKTRSTWLGYLMCGPGFKDEDGRYVWEDKAHFTYLVKDDIKLESQVAFEHRALAEHSGDNIYPFYIYGDEPPYSDWQKRVQPVSAEVINVLPNSDQQAVSNTEAGFTHGSNDHKIHIYALKVKDYAGNEAYSEPIFLKSDTKAPEIGLPTEYVKPADKFLSDYKSELPLLPGAMIKLHDDGDATYSVSATDPSGKPHECSRVGTGMSSWWVPWTDRPDPQVWQPQFSYIVEDYAGNIGGGTVNQVPNLMFLGKDGAYTYGVAGPPIMLKPRYRLPDCDVDFKTLRAHVIYYIPDPSAPIRQDWNGTIQDYGVAGFITFWPESSPSLGVWGDDVFGTATDQIPESQMDYPTPVSILFGLNQDGPGYTKNTGTTSCGNLEILALSPDFPKRADPIAVPGNISVQQQLTLDEVKLSPTDAYMTSGSCFAALSTGGTNGVSGTLTKTDGTSSSTLSGSFQVPPNIQPGLQALYLESTSAGHFMGNCSGQTTEVMGRILGYMEPTDPDNPEIGGMVPFWTGVNRVVYVFASLKSILPAKTNLITVYPKVLQTGKQQTIYVRGWFKDDWSEGQTVSGTFDFDQSIGGVTASSPKCVFDDPFNRKNVQAIELQVDVSANAPTGYRTLTLTAGDVNGLVIPDAVCVVEVNIDSIVLPNNFIALPDKVSHDRFFLGGADITQWTTTRMAVYYSILPAGFSFDSAKLKIELDAKRTVEYDLALKSGQGVIDIRDVELEDDWLVDNDSTKLKVSVVGRKGSVVCESDKKEVDGKRLLANLDFLPQAYKIDSPVCPYTHKQASLTGDPNQSYYGLLITYDLNAILKPDEANNKFARISGGDAGGKVLRTTTLARQLGQGCKVKWEGYDDTIDEDPSLPYCVFPTSTANQPAPKCVVKEGTYKLHLNAVANTGFLQSHSIQGIPIDVRYNTSDSEVQP